MSHSLSHSFVHPLTHLFSESLARSIGGFYIVDYGLGIFLLNQFILFISPQFDPEDDGLGGDVGLPNSMQEAEEMKGLLIQTLSQSPTHTLTHLYHAQVFPENYQNFSFGIPVHALSSLVSF